MGTKFKDAKPLTEEEEAEIQRQIASDPDAPEATDEELAQAKPFAEAFPDLAESIKRSRGRPAVDNPRQQISLRLEPEVIAKFKATGKGWQGKINDILKHAKI
ncbi:BrnA antitoxin family protein [Phyllobacterium sp. UNC302MFCol5.2]|uniref:BrnA antitoxin family protein n=1 Tax=Phyllobacterium sp. UNC302MFCol5.2 TaxID=1449065 RepID=UPI000487099B|nr:BrnA antitoxin family protein [Phyllobacterium sp. UNC302MFCol5.2]